MVPSRISAGTFSSTVTDNPPRPISIGMLLEPPDELLIMNIYGSNLVFKFLL
jgi:hypothetical protein